MIVGIFCSCVWFSIHFPSFLCFLRCLVPNQFSSEVSKPTNKNISSHACPTYSFFKPFTHSRTDSSQMSSHNHRHCHQTSDRLHYHGSRQPDRLVGNPNTFVLSSNKYLGFPHKFPVIGWGWALFIPKQTILPTLGDLWKNPENSHSYSQRIKFQCPRQEFYTRLWYTLQCSWKFTPLHTTLYSHC